jgi:TolB-like protein/class 3 adenylate cyclase/Tfp pilus assembly protein PilF
MERRLAAIVAADVVGYSCLMEADEAGTLSALKARRTEMLQPLVAKHHGRIVKLMGDGVLVEFASAVNAVECAIELQVAMERANRNLPENRRIVLRVGVNVGDVIVEDGDLFGDGVNVAARLEALAEPGTIYVSGAVHSHVRSKIQSGFEDLGEQALKNMVEPVRVYKLIYTPGSQVNPAVPKAAQPSIAVLPFTNMSGDPEQGYFSDGVTEDIITELSRFRDLLVIARNSSFRYRGKDVDIRQVGRELDVDYVIEGSIRRSGDHLRITAQLIEAKSGNHIWAERYDRDMRDVFTVQEEMARSIAATVGGRIEAVGLDRAVRSDPAALKAYDLILRVKALAFKYTKKDNAQARELALRAIAINPLSAKAHSYVGYCHMMDYVTHWVADREAALALAYEFERKAVALDEADIEVRWKFGQVLLARGEFEEAQVHFARALKVNPNDTEARCQYGVYLDCMGRHDEAIEHFELAKRRNPFDPPWLFWVKGIAYFGARRYGEAIALLNQIVEPPYEVYGWIATAYGHLGRIAEARAKLEEFFRGAKHEMAAFPGLRLRDWDTYWRGAMWYKNQSDFDHLFEGLRKAGMPG